IRTSAGLRIPGHTAVLGCNESVISISSNREPKDTVIGKMKSKGSQGKRAQAPIPSNNVLSVSEAECDDIGMDSSSAEEMEVEMDASTSKVAASDHIGSASTHINSPMPKG
ncbi:unnamed protein product, partial [Linum tenue]